MRELLLRILLLLPWFGLFYMLYSGFSGEMDWLLAIVLFVILVPVVATINLVTIIFFKGKEFMSQLRQMNQKTLKSKSYDKPWWHPKRWL